ncbi:MAG: sulfur oxidation c-type cytochrome SoxA [Rhizobiaceae bacterium]|nr:sulfur oxidation c-type cytochrome SoxA [Rhizobiaceae bacterium]
MAKSRNSIASILAAAGIVAAGVYGTASAGPDDNQLIVEGQSMVTEAAAPEGVEVEKIYSGWRFRSSETQSLQMDDFENPAMPLVDIGTDIWGTEDGAAGKSCQSCHNDASDSMKGIRAGYPKWSDKRGKPHTLETQINECRTDRMEAKAWKWESSEMLSMTALVGFQSRGMPVNVTTDGPMTKWHDMGKDLYFTRVGQLNMSCANCHEDNYGNMIRADHLSQGQINGFPTYRLKWGGVGSSHRRFKGCMENIRAVAYKRGSDEFIALELYLASRGQGLSVETPAVRN